MMQNLTMHLLSAVLDDGYLDVSYVLNVSPQQIPGVLKDLTNMKDAAKLKDTFHSMRVQSLDVECPDGLQVGLCQILEPRCALLSLSFSVSLVGPGGTGFIHAHHDSFVHRLASFLWQTSSMKAVRASRSSQRPAQCSSPPTNLLTKILLSLHIKVNMSSSSPFVVLLNQTELA